MNHYEWAGKKHFASVKFEGQSGGRTRDIRLSKHQLHQGPCHSVHNAPEPTDI